jgi:hypothetical protein
MIHATCHTADNIVCLEYATPWFSEADAQADGEERHPAPSRGGPQSHDRVAREPLQSE